MKDEVEAQFMALSTEDKLEIVMDLWDSIADELASQPLTRVQEEEMARRLEYLREHPDDARPWADVKTEIEEELKSARSGSQASQEGK